MDGIIIINKPKGCTSHDIVYKIKKILGEKVGHTGTLDPNATGVLPILVGNGTKLSKYLINHNKKYIATIQLGIRTDTADSEGNIVEEKQVPKINSDIIKNILIQFIGKQTQTPPIYSAIKVKGKKLYEYARKGENVEIPKREIEIYGIELINIDEKFNQIEVQVECSKGTYIRTLCEDIAEKLETVGYMKELMRSRVGEFTLEKSVSIEEIEKNKNDINFIKNNLITLEKLLKECKQISLKDAEISKFFNGVKLEKDFADGIYRIYNNNIFIGTGVIENKFLKRDVVV